MIGRAPTVRVQEVVGRSHRTEAVFAVFVYTFVAQVAQHDAVVDLAYPRISSIARATQLVGDDVMRVVVRIDEACAAMRTQAPLPEERLPFRGS